MLRAVVNDRGETGWTSRKDYEVVDKSRLEPSDQRRWTAGLADILGVYRW
ncbi:hypothetical protein ACIBTV_29655 [Micromonospora sp. NPDC049366]